MWMMLMKQTSWWWMTTAIMFGGWGMCTPPTAMMIMKQVPTGYMLTAPLPMQQPAPASYMFCGPDPKFAHHIR